MNSAKSSGLNRIYLAPGEIVLTDKNEQLWMVLGSCVSVILWHPKTKMTAACHAQLPKRIQLVSEKKKNGCGDVLATHKPKDGHIIDKYLDCSFLFMIEKLKLLKVKLNEMNVFLLGGSKLFQFESKRASIGEQNVAFAHTLLRDHNLKIDMEDTGGIRGRTITFDTVEGIPGIKIQNVTKIDPKLLSGEVHAPPSIFSQNKSRSGA